MCIRTVCGGGGGRAAVEADGNGGYRQNGSISCLVTSVGKQYNTV